MDSKAKILFVEDDAIILKMMVIVLQHFNYEVVPVRTPNRALKLFQDEPHSFDLVITDYQMPQMDGEALSCKMRTIRSDIPIILCSGKDLMIYEFPHQASVNRFVSKPYDIDEFKLVVEQVLESPKL